ncbi:MAG TPA: cytosine permease, partial [Mycobacterium sp.]|nr:cytosine permease [Mycobacterium sp.]
MSKRAAWTAEAFSGNRPRAAGDLSVESHGIAPIPPGQRYGSPARLFTVWFAPQVTMTGVFTGTLAIALGLGFWLGLLAMTIGTVFGLLGGILNPGSETIVSIIPGPLYHSAPNAYSGLSVRAGA